MLSRLVQLCPLAPAHRTALLSDGIQEADLDQYCFGSLPSPCARVKLTEKLISEFGEEKVRKYLPGAYEDKTGVLSIVPNLSPGWILGIPDPLERGSKGKPSIRAVRLRLDRPFKDEKGKVSSKYLWLSSKKHGGAKANLTALLTGSRARGDSPLVVVEGEKKALIASRHLQTWALAVPGVNQTKMALPVIERHSVQVVQIAHDADRWQNPAVALHFVRGVEHLITESREMGFEVKGLRWWDGLESPRNCPKGVDDGISAGCPLVEYSSKELLAECYALKAKFDLSDTPQESTKAGKEDEKQAETLMRLARERFEFFRSPVGTLYFSHVVTNQHSQQIRVTHSLTDKERLTDALRLELYEDKGETASPHHLNQVADTLRVINRYKSPVRPVSRRVQQIEETFYIDIGDEQGSVVEVSDGSWKLVTDCPARFIRNQDLGILPYPERGGTVDELYHHLRLLNSNQEKLAICWIIQSLSPSGPYPALLIEGEQGAGKTTLGRRLIEFVDPLRGDVGSPPKDPEDFAVLSNYNHLNAFDNIGRIPQWLSDLLCKSSTGGSLSVRQRYTDCGVVTHRLNGPVVLIGISDLVKSPDLLERIVRIEGERIPKAERKDERSFWKAFDRDKGRIFGALLDVFAKAHQIRDQIKLAELPRMADFAILSEAVGRVLGWEEGFFAKAYEEMQEELILETVESSPLATALHRFMECRETYRGTATELLQDLEDPSITTENTRRSKVWPQASNALSREMRKMRTFLRERGIEWSSERSGRGGTRVITLTNRGAGRVAEEECAALEGIWQRSESLDDTPVRIRDDR